MSAAVQRHNALISIIRLFLIYFILTSFPPFYRAMLCIRGTSHGPVSVCPSLTSRSSTKTAKRIQLVFWHVNLLAPVLHCVKRKFGYLQK